MLNRRFVSALIALWLSVSAISGETVWLTAKGKTFHRDRQCMALTRAKHVLTTDRATAETHGLKPCGICYRDKAAPKPDNSAWAKKAAKTR